MKRKTKKDKLIKIIKNENKIVSFLPKFSYTDWEKKAGKKTIPRK